MRVQVDEVTQECLQSLDRDVEVEMNMSFCSFIQQTPIKQIFGAKHLSKNRYSLSLWNFMD